VTIRNKVTKEEIKITLEELNNIFDHNDFKYEILTIDISGNHHWKTITDSALMGFAKILYDVTLGDNGVRCTAHPRVVAIGETGLDYYYSTDNKAEQQHAFREHIRLSRALKKPVIVHTRDAKEDTLTILCEECVGEAGGVLHCFTEDWPMAQAALALGMCISISGIVTFRNADALREVTRQIPADRLLIETDSPYLAPVPHRGHQNEPAYVADVAAFIAELRGVTVETLAAQTSENFFRLFSQAQR
jgi:TatD DNase family protein